MVKNNENSRTYLKNITLPLPPCPATKKRLYYSIFLYRFFFLRRKLAPTLTTMPGAGFLTKLTMAPLSFWIDFTVIPRLPTSSPWYLAYNNMYTIFSQLQSSHACQPAVRGT